MAQAPKSRKPRLKAGGIGAQSSEPDLFAELQPATSLKSSATIPKLPPLPPGVTLQDLQCVICKELFHDPRVLPCKHVTCFLCLGDRVTKDNCVICPICNRPMKLGSLGAFGLEPSPLAPIAQQLRSNSSLVQAVKNLSLQQAAPPQPASSPSSFDFLAPAAPSPVVLAPQASSSDKYDQFRVFVEQQKTSIPTLVPQPQPTPLLTPTPSSMFPPTTVYIPQSTPPQPKLQQQPQPVDPFLAAVLQPQQQPPPMLKQQPIVPLATPQLQPVRSAPPPASVKPDNADPSGFFQYEDEPDDEEEAEDEYDEDDTQEVHQPTAPPPQTSPRASLPAAAAAAATATPSTPAAASITNAASAATSFLSRASALVSSFVTYEVLAEPKPFDPNYHGVGPKPEAVPPAAAPVSTPQPTPAGPAQDVPSSFAQQPLPTSGSGIAGYGTAKATTPPSSFMTQPQTGSYPLSALGDMGIAAAPEPSIYDMPSPATATAAATPSPTTGKGRRAPRKSAAFLQRQAEKKAQEEAARQELERSRQAQLSARDAIAQQQWAETQRLTEQQRLTTMSQVSALKEREAADRAARQARLKELKHRNDPTPQLGMIADGASSSENLLNWSEFLVKPEEVRTHFNNWMLNLWFAPEKMSQKVLLNAINPVYLPFYIFECHTLTQYKCEVCRAVETVGPGGEKKSKDVWSQMQGMYKGQYNDILVCASPRTEEWAWVLTFKDWDPTKIYFEPDPNALRNPPKPKPEEQSFASRFFKTIVESIPQRVPPRPLATQLQPAEPWHIIWHEYERKSIRPEEERQCTNKVLAESRGKSVASMKIHSTYDVTKRLVYMPAYVSSYTYEGKAYRFCVQGQTASVEAERPYGLGAVATTSRAAFAAITESLFKK